MVTGMSFGALSRNAKTALSRGARLAGTSTTTGDGGMLDVERSESRLMIYEVLPSRFGINVQHLRQADAIELTISQGAKPGTGGLLLGSKVSAEIAQIRDLPPGIDQRSPCRHPDFLGPDDLVIKIEELREATEYRVPIFVKMGASRVFDDVRLAAKAGADVIVIDGMEGGTGASPELLQEHTGIPTLAAVCEARAALEDIGLYGKVQLVIAGGLRHGSDCAKAIALGADACYLGTALLIALNCNKPIYLEDYAKIGAAPYRCHHCHTGRCPVGITTQDPELSARLEVQEASERVANFFHALTSEIQMLARACGKSDVHHLEPEDLRALTLEASMITGLPLAGTNRVSGGGPGWKNGERGH
jgi:glutamate synthase domain-containing protein 2